VGAGLTAKRISAQSWKTTRNSPKSIGLRYYNSLAQFAADRGEASQMLFVAANCRADIHARSIFFCSFLSSETTVSSNTGMVIMQTKDQYQKGISNCGYSVHKTIYIITQMALFNFILIVEDDVATCDNEDI
jgi:hypothetical protein